MTEIDTSTAAIAALMDGVTAGPWRVEHETTLIWGHCDKDDSTYRGMGYPVAECRISPVSSWAHGPDADAGETNARFIAAARELVPALTDERDAAVARAEQDEARVAELEAEAALCTQTARAEAAEAALGAVEYYLGSITKLSPIRIAGRNANGAYILYEDGSAIIKMKSGAKASPVKIPIPVAASRAPDPVANAGSCQTGDTIRQLLERHEAEMRAKGRNPLDYTSKWKQAADVVASLPAAPVAEAKHIEDKILSRAEEIEKKSRNG